MIFIHQLGPGIYHTKTKPKISTNGNLKQANLMKILHLDMFMQTIF